MLKTCRIIKEEVRKARKTQPLLQSKIIVNNIEINEDKQIANNFFINIGPGLAKDIPKPARSFESYVPKSNSTLPTGPISVSELKNFFLNKDK